ncbi:MAG: tetraacyldisaccharide 4'-kinase, partial [Candidatus Poribacteria bacterium]|nr:tetraacyldisaccharide 4'-kinase [Candidatus Poribacteria bacterium]
RADIILLTHADTPEISVRAKETVKRLAPDALVLESVHQPTCLYPLFRENSGERQDVEGLKGKRLLAVCGIGNPDAFVGTLRRCAPASVELLAFPDHHVYVGADAQRIDAAFRAAKADLVVTTQKDAQKLGSVMEHQGLQAVVLVVALVITEGDEKLTKVLLANVGKSWNRKPQTANRKP